MGEVSLVRVTRVDGHAAELLAAARGRQRASQAQHATQTLGSVADGPLEAPAQRDRRWSA